MTYKIGIIGASGYTGIELIRILKRHSELNLVATAALETGQNLSDIIPCPFDVPLVSAEDALNSGLDAAFCALPSGASMKLVQQLHEQGVKVVDFSADFRLKDVATYEKYYKIKHTVPHLLEEAVYGLPELYRKSIAKANIIANPGCYPTTILLGLFPLINNGDIDLQDIIIDAKSGVSGAGRKLENNLLFCEANENVTPYNIGHVHRHLSEIEDQLSQLAGKSVSVIFSPHLLPLNQGMLSTIYVKLRKSANFQDIYQKYVNQYQSEPFVKILPQGKLASVHYVAHTNFCYISLTIVPEKNLLIIVSTIDNLIKGASGQAVQNMNIMLGLPETMGLL
ncbi:MAG: N-acetyl-gamma-glutamyl-phosphate reductase [Promethearchaeota archaeon CR_4]|nr:MAG: N-acetyl-gamma-glutamyl-phosphate reductase [Candidatus Lokiarchaeota archaeon CR_4]